jgi:hypothetical protein
VIDRKKLDKIKKRIFKEFPEFKGVEPKVKEKKIRPQSTLYKKLSLGTPKRFKKIVTLKFKKKIKTVDQIEIERILTVTLDEENKIIKVTESR